MFLLPPLNLFLFNLSFEYSAQVYGTGLSTPKADIIRSLMISALPFGLSVHSVPPMHSLVQAAPSSPSYPGQYMCPWFLFHRLHPSLCSAGPSSSYVCVLSSLSSVKISCNFSVCVLRTQKVIVHVLASCSEPQTSLPSFPLSIFTWLSRRYLFLVQCAPKTVFMIHCLQSLSSQSFKLVRP